MDSDEMLSIRTMSGLNGSLRNRKKSEFPCRFCGTPLMAYSPSSAVCPSCKPMEERERQEAETASTLKNFLEGGLHRHLVSAGMGPLELSCDLNQVRPELLALTQAQVDPILTGAGKPGRFSKGFGLSGPPGTGKTGLMAALTRAWAEKKGVHFIQIHGVLWGPWRPRWVSWPQMVDRLRMAQRDQMELNDLMLAMQVAPLLVLDDLGAEVPSEFGRGKLYEILQHRSNDGRGLLWTTNMPGDAFAENYGPHNLSRLLALAPAIKLPGLPDRRREFAHLGYVHQSISHSII